MDRRAYSASRKARVMQAKANLSKEKTRSGSDRLLADGRDQASS